MMLAPCTGNTAIVSRATDTGTEAPKRPVHCAGTGEWSKTQESIDVRDGQRFGEP
jgi:hypothetical protein